MLYKKYHRNYVRQFKKGVKFRFNRFRIYRAEEPILSVVFDPFISICPGPRGYGFWGFNVSINVDICIIELDGKLSNNISIVTNDDIVPETEKISKLCCIKNIIENTLANLRKAYYM